MVRVSAPTTPMFVQLLLIKRLLERHTSLLVHVVLVYVSADRIHSQLNHDAGRRRPSPYERGEAPLHYEVYIEGDRNS